MKFTPDSDNEHFNEWYKEFHLLFEDSYGDREEVIEIAQACYDRAGEKKSEVIGTLAGELIWCMDNLRPVKGSGLSIKDGVLRGWKVRLKEALETIPGATVAL